MRYFCLSALTLVAVCGLVPSAVFGQGTPSNLSITNYQFVSEQRISSFSSYVTYRADLVNNGPARVAVTASLTSRASNIQVSQGLLHFAPVPASRTVTSLDTFTILVDRSVEFNFADLQWTFLAPAANAGPNRTAKVGSLVILDGSGSTNPSGFGTLAYNWKIQSAPTGSSALLFWYDTVAPQFTVDLPGTYVISLTVSNGAGSDTDTVTVSTGNTPPVANAGANRTVSPGTVVTLNGSGSSDVDGDPLTYAWSITNKPTGSNAVLLAPTSVTPVFTVDKVGSYDIRLIVNDGKVDSAPKVVTITTQNTPPVANAGTNQVRPVGALVQLDGSASTDVDGDPLTYQWSLIGLPSGSGAVLSSTTAVKPTFTADLSGTYVAQLIVNDGKAPSAAVTVQITTNPPLAPMASAGPNQTVVHGTTVHLSGTGTDPQNLPLTFHWSLSAKPPLSTAVLSSATIQNPTFVADLPGNYVAQLIVNDGIQSSSPSMVTITTTNTAPVANPGLNQAVPVPANVSLDGSGSSDADNDPLTYAWSFSSRPPGSSAALSSLTALRPTFFADVTGTYVVQLIVNDGFANSSPVTVTITAGVKAITLSPNPLNLSTNTTGTLTLTLGSVAGPGGQIVFLDSSNATIASVPANVTVPEGLGGVNVTILPGSGAGSTTITAIASGFTPTFATINVTPPTVKMALSPGTIGLTRTANGTITLSSPAPNGGVSVSVSDPSGFVTFQPAMVPIAAGATTATFTATGTVIGSTTILAIAPGYNTGTASVTVAMLGAITLLPNVTVGPGQSLTFPVSLVTGAPVGGVTIDLVSSDTSKVTISPASVTIAQGQTTPAQQPTVTGVNLGSADISASAPGFFGDKKTIQVAANISFLQQTLTIGANGTQDLTLNFSGQAPVGGLTINLSSTNSGVATVPSTVTIAATKSSVTVPVTGVKVGTSVIHASAAGLADTTATVNVVNVGAIGLPANQTVGLGTSMPFSISLPSPAPAGGVTVTLASSDTSKVTISAASVTIAGGQTTPPGQPTVTGVSFGTATISATAPGYTAASSQVQVATIMGFASPTVSITGLTTQNVALNLSAGAPGGGLTVNFTSSNTSVVTVPASVSFAANSTSVNVLLTAVGQGSATITAASVTPGIANATASVTVSTGSSPGTINLPPSGALGLGVTAAFPVSLSSPATAPVTIALASSNSTKVTLSLASVTIATGQTTPPVQPTVTGVNFGTANILATASGFTPASSSVQVNASVVFSPPSLTLSAGTQNLTLTLSAAAPAGGVIINLSSSNTPAATVPATVSFAAGSNTTTVPVTAVGPGTATIHASSLPNIADSTASVNVQGGIALPANVTVPPSQQTPFLVTLGTPARSGGVIVSLSSSDTSKVTVVSPNLFFAEGQTTPTFPPAVKGVDFGNSTITATANGLASATAVVKVTGSVHFFPGSLTLASGSATKNLSLMLSTFPASSVTFTLSSSNTGAATVPLTVTIPANENNVNVPVTPIGPGSTTITASTVTPNLANTTASVTITAPGLITLPVNLSAGLSASVDFPVILGSPAPTGGVTVSLSSDDTSKLTISPATVFIASGDTTPAVQAKVTGVNIGSVHVSASAPGYTSATVPVQVTANLTFSPPSLSVVGTSTQNFTVTLSGRAPVGGITVTVSSSKTSVATIPNQQFTFLPNGGLPSSLSIPITGVAVGSAVIHVGAPPFIPDTTANVTVLAAGVIGLPSNLSVEPGHSVPFPINLGTPAPAGGVTVNLTSSDATKLTVSTASVVIAAGDSAPLTQPTVTGVDYGTVNLNATATGYTSGSAAVKVTTTLKFASPAVTITGVNTQNVALNITSAAPAGGLKVNLMSSNTGVATVPASVTIAAGATTVNVPITSVAPGPTTITATPVPATVAAATTNVTVTAPLAITLPSSPAVGLGKSVTFAVSLSSPAAADMTINLVSGDTSKVTISTASITIPAGQTAPGVQPTITGAGLGSASITASGPGVSTTAVTVQVNATMSFTPPSVTITGLVTQNLTLTLSGQAPAGGLTINLSSNATTVATVPATVTFAAGATTTSVPVTAVAVGPATITASTLAPNLSNAAVTVTVVAAGSIGLPNSPTVGLGKQATFAVTLPQAAVAPVTVTLSSTDSSTLTISPTTVTIAAGQTTPPTQPQISGVKLGTATINASAPGFASSSVLVQVNATVNFTPGTLTINGFNTQNLTLNLSTQAPAGGITINLSSSTPATATVPSTVSFAAGATTVSVPVTGLAFGTTVIHASAAPNIADATANVTVQSAGTITVPASTSVSLGTGGTLAISLPSPAAAPVTVTVTSSDPSKVLISAGPFTIAQGATTPATQPQLTGVNIGSVTITASAPGYASGTGTAQTTATVLFSPPTISIAGIGTQNILLILSAPAPSAGLIVNLSSATPSVVTVPSSVTFPASATSISVPVTSVSIGSAVIHASASPFIPDATATVNVGTTGNVVVPSSATVSMGSGGTLTISLSAPAPSALTVTLGSSDTSIVTVSPTVTIAKGATTTATQPTITGVKIGTASISASAPGYGSGTTPVQVNATVSFDPATVTITGPKTQNLTLTLSSAAPTGGVTVSVSSSNTVVATTPATVTFAAGATTANVPVTALTLGTTVIHANATIFIPDATANVTVVTAGPIGVPTPISLGLGSSGPFVVTLPAASANPVTVTLTSTAPTKVSVTSTVTIPAGQTTPSPQPGVNGINVGSASISVSAPGYDTASQTVTVGATVSWPQATIPFSGLGAQSVTLTLSANAPAGGLTVNVSSSNTPVATVPATATFAAGTKTTTVTLTALSEGSTVLHASGVNIPDATATLTVAVPTLGRFTITGASVGKDLETRLSISLDTVVPPGLPLQVTVSSSDGSKLVLGSLLTAGTKNTVLGFPAGTNSGDLYAQALSDTGSVTVTVSAPGYTSGSSQVNLTPSGFVVTGPTGIVGTPNFLTNVGSTTTLTVMTARLNSSFVYQESQVLRGGFSVSVPLVSSIGTVGSLNPTSRTFTPADTAYTTTFTALTTGNTILSATPPATFSLPSGGANGIQAQVNPGIAAAPNVTVGQSLEIPAQITLTGAPSADTTITLTSSDPSRLRFGGSATDAGAGMIPIPGCVPPIPDPTNVCKIIKIRAGQSHSPDIYFQALGNTGSVTYTANVPNIGTSTGTVTLRPSGILIAGPFGLGNSISTTSNSASTDLTIQSAMLDTSRNFVELQAVAPITGVPPVTVNVTSSDTGVGLITVSPVTIPAGSAGATSGFQPGSPGSSTLSVSVPTGFSVPNQFGSVVASVSVSGIALICPPDSSGLKVSLGKFLQMPCNFSLGANAPAGGVVVTLASFDSSKLLLSTSPTAAGSATISVTVPSGASSGTYYVQSLTDTGVVAYNANAPGFAPNNQSITLTKSGIVIGDGSGGTLFGNLVPVSMAQLNPGGNFGQIQQLAGGHPSVSIAIATDIVGATIVSPLILSAGSSTATAAITVSGGSGLGQHVMATTPPGFTDSLPKAGSLNPSVLSVVIFF